MEQQASPLLWVWAYLEQSLVVVVRVLLWSKHTIILFLRAKTSDIIEMKT